MSTLPRDSIDVWSLTPEILAEMDDREFRTVVSIELRKDASNERERVDVPDWLSQALRREHAGRRLAALRAMLANVDGQIEMRANARAEAEATSNYEAGRAAVAEYHNRVKGPLRFRAALLEALPEAERAASSATDDRTDQLERAIRAHRQAIEQDEDLEPSAADEALWAMVSE